MSNDQSLTQITSSFDRHMLTLTDCNGDSQKNNCSWCHRPITSQAYACLNCEFYLHKDCTKIPNQLLSPFHPQHSLSSSNLSLGGPLTCDTCKTTIMGIALSCSNCQFNLHFLCSEPHMPTLKHPRHKHELLYFFENNDINFKCDVCGDCCDGSFYRCVRCDLNFHLDCLPIPKTVKSERHVHDFMLLDCFKEDDVEACRCDICELQRNPDHHVYCCKECEFLSHIECALNLIYEAEQSYSQQQTETKPENSSQELKDTMGFKHFSHEHPLLFREDYEKINEESLCYGCLEKISGPAYACDSCEYACLHKACAEYPLHVQHPLHSLHSLSLLAAPPYGFGIDMCHNCRHLSMGFIYHCSECRFSLDVKCGTSLSNDEGQESEDDDTKPPINYFGHEHMLTFSYGRNFVFCEVCNQEVLGPCYGCIGCSFFMHESCTQKPQKIRHPCHPQHSFMIQNPETEDKECNLCHRTINRVGYYSCSDCIFYLHFDCVDSTWYTLKHKCHVHELLYFPSEVDHNDFFCHACKDICDKIAFYRCVDCDLNFHLKCIPLPSTVKHDCHSHPLSLLDSLMEDDSVCDICEKERNPSHHVYYCEECTYIAHIHCVISEE